MAKTRFLQSSFVSGELSPLLKGRVDLNQYYQGVQTAKNLVIVPQGGMKRRPGTQYVQTVNDNGANHAIGVSSALTLSAGDYIQANFAVDDVNVWMNAAAATAFAPAANAIQISIIKF